MKHFTISHKLMLALTLVCAFTITSCSDADEPEFDKAYSRSLSDGTETITYEITSLQLFDMNPLTKGKWKEVDLMNYCGFTSSAPGSMIIQDGKIWTTYSTWSCVTGPTLIGQIWDAYIYSTKKKLRLFLSQKFEVNEENSSLKIGHSLFTVNNINKTSLVLTHYSKYAGGESGEGGTHKEIARYKATASYGFDENSLTFDSEVDLMRGVIALAREQFGETIDLNKVYQGIVEFDNPDRYVLNLHDIEVQLGLI